MATMEDLVASLGGNMHVSQDGYELKALHEFLSQNLAMPPITPMSPTAHFHGMPSSRSASVTRKPTSLPSTYPYTDALNQPLPTPSAYSMYPAEHDDEPMFSPRPGTLRRSSSYGFGTPVNAGLSGFESDAFAPLAFGGPSAKPPAGSSNPWAAFQKQPTQVQVQVQEVQGSNDPEPESQDYGGDEDYEDEDDERMMMDEDEADESMMDEDEEEEKVERVMGIGGSGQRSSWGSFGGQGAAGWDRGRRG
ncbi:hypothetical protein BCR39DRAFT_522843 [Naematelia encephala]|uniref:Uncharacterized protein n=1 Tax=Naematelia encephala TaxID=71784 RepID=A0A1Y2BCL9_9TREE|nr:hypothetical protein BCR39DRAFT_522843 [Naematelia encephala]